VCSPPDVKQINEQFSGANSVSWVLVKSYIKCFENTQGSKPLLE
jgi:hypothetical protein